MLFNSIEFLIFFPVTAVVYFLLPQKLRRYFLLAASCCFYMSFIPKYMLILLFSTVLDYAGARLIGRFRDRPGIKKAVFAVGLTTNIVMLAMFKYLGVIGETVNFFGNKAGLTSLTFPEFVLPVGISFHTFQNMGYFIDVYTGKAEPEEDFIDFALFLMYFPQLVAGPIERIGNLLPQLKAEHTLKPENISLGGRKMLWGMFKKVVVADNLALFADAVFNHPKDYSGMGLVIGVFAFAVQIYCDFSGYSDIALGASKIMDIDLMTNFTTPYFSASVPEFWRRWHISLSTWFRDYIYIPLGGNRVSKPRWCLNQLVTFTVSGIWHGAGYTYVLWGFLNGLYIITSKLTKPAQDKIAAITRFDKVPKIRRCVGVVFTFVLISFTWIFFRANTFADAFYIIRSLFSPTTMDFSTIPELRVCVSIAAAAVLFAVELFQNVGRNVLNRIFTMPHPVRLVLYAVAVAVIVIFGAYDNKAFIYFQF